MKLLDWRKSQGLTLEEFSTVTGLSAASLSRYETGKNRPSFKSAELLEKVTGGEVTPQDFYL